MSDDFEGIPLDQPAEVPADIQPDGAVTEVPTGEQVADEGGNPAWYDATYPGQIQNAPEPSTVETTLAQQNQTVIETPTDVSSVVANLPGTLPSTATTSIVDPASLNATVANLPSTLPSTSVPASVDPGSLNATVANLPGTAIPSESAMVFSAAAPTQDAYGLNILNAEQTQELTRNINPAFISNLTDPNAPPMATATNAVNTSAVPLDANNTGVSYSMDQPSGRQLVPTDVLAATDPAAQDRIQTFNQPPTVSARAVDTGAGAAIAAANEQAVADATRLNAQLPNPYLQNIEQAGVEIAKGQEGIATANNTIQSAQQKIADSESYIAQNNAELADPNISDERRAVLEANNAEQVQNILDQTQSINENEAYIASTQETIQANQAAIDSNIAGYRATTSASNVPVVDVNTDPNFVGPQQVDVTIINPTNTARPIDPTTLEGYGVNAVGATVAQPFGSDPDGEATAAVATQVGRQLAQQQAVLAAQKRVVNNSDWRVRLQLAPGATYLYNAPTGPNGAGPGILWPLKQTDGVIFPYTPKITMNYKADYEAQVLTHSNYKGYFYKSSYADAVQLNATFTAQDTAEAQYLLAVIHFFRSVTKMFYGQDANRGAPPPLVYLTGLGEFQFAQHPCVVANFNYSLPNDVDYIRARSTNVNGTDLITRRDKQSLPTNPISGAVARLQNLFSSQGINKGAVYYPPPVPNLGLNQPTYVPTKMDIDLVLYPIQSRQQVSKVFDNRQYNTGAQLKGGFW